MEVSSSSCFLSTTVDTHPALRRPAIIRSFASAFENTCNFSEKDEVDSYSQWLLLKKTQIRNDWKWTRGPGMAEFGCSSNPVSLEVPH